MRFWILERLDHAVHLQRWAWLIPARVETWICDRYEDAIWGQFPDSR